MKMKKNGFGLLFLLLMTVFSAGNLSAQTKKKPVAKKTTAKPTAKPGAKPAVTDTKVLDANASAPVKQDTVKPAPPPPPRVDPFASLDSTRVSLREDAFVKRELNKSRTPLPYENLREDDAFYRERIWREIDIREKMNLPFRYKAEDDNGNQRFINILIKSIRKGEVTAFDATIDDRFTTPLASDSLAKRLFGSAKTLQVPDYAKDPDGSKGIMKDSLITNEFNPDDVVKFRIKEEWVFDKESSKMFIRILGIAPIKKYVDDNTGAVLGEGPIFWIWYPDLRPVLARYEVYNGKNFGARMSWEELFESRYFSSYIVKSTMDNPYDMNIRDYIKDPILRLLESENIKNKIQNFEMDVWSY
jgi:gliding motility associated protien GldN